MAVPFGIVFLWLGYALGYYGYNRITGGNDHFLDLLYPGRYHAVARDNGSGGPSSSSSPSSSSPAVKPSAVKPATRNKAAGPGGTARVAGPA